MLIDSDHYGKPSPGSGLGHFVRVTDNPNFSAINQLDDGGKYPHADCGPACLESIFKDYGINDPVPTVEIQDGTNSSGTQVAGLVKALQDEGLAATVIDTTPPAGDIMNPLGGLRLGADPWFPQYAAAFAGQTIIIHAQTGPAPQPGGEPMNQGQANANAAMMVRFADDEHDPRQADWSPLATALLNGDEQAVVAFVDTIKHPYGDQIAALQTELASLQAQVGTTVGQRGVQGPPEPPGPPGPPGMIATVMSGGATAEPAPTPTPVPVTSTSGGSWFQKVLLPDAVTVAGVFAMGYPQVQASLGHLPQTEAAPLTALAAGAYTLAKAIQRFTGGSSNGS